MDELFLLPPSTIAMPRAYWLPPDQRLLSSNLMLITPSEFQFQRIQEKIAHKSKNDYDMEIVNYMYRDHCMVIPHRPYNLISGEYRSEDHTAYLGVTDEKWEPEKIRKEAKLIHFSDWPLPKVRNLTYVII
jgi:alpha-N-acetylglucosamine transferase